MIQSEDKGDITIIRFKVRNLMDVEVIKTVFDEIYKLAAEIGRHRLILDVGGVEFLSSFVLGKLMMVKKKVETAGGRMVLCHVAPQIKIIFQGPLKPLFDI